MPVSLSAYIPQPPHLCHISTLTRHSLKKLYFNLLIKLVKTIIPYIIPKIFSVWVKFKFIKYVHTYICVCVSSVFRELRKIKLFPKPMHHAMHFTYTNTSHHPSMYKIHFLSDSEQAAKLFSIKIKSVMIIL